MPIIASCWWKLVQLTTLVISENSGKTIIKGTGTTSNNKKNGVDVQVANSRGGGNADGHGEESRGGQVIVEVLN